MQFSGGGRVLSNKTRSDMILHLVRRKTDKGGIE